MVQGISLVDKVGLRDQFWLPKLVHGTSLGRQIWFGNQVGNQFDPCVVFLKIN